LEEEIKTDERLRSIEWEKVKNNLTFRAWMSRPEITLPLRE
jgi:hypothetical protein